MPDRRRRLYAVLLGGGLILLIPWRFDVTAHGVAHAERQQQVFAPFPAMLAELQMPGRVTEGALLARFETPEVESKKLQATVAAAALERRLSGLLDTEDGVDQQMALNRRLHEQNAEAKAAGDELQRLTLVAPFDGEWKDVDLTLRPGVWLGTREPLGVLVDPGSWVVDAYVEQRLVDRIEPGASAEFLPEGSLRAFKAEVLEVDPTRSQRRVHPLLDSRHGGKLATRQEGQESVLSEAMYRVRLRLEKPVGSPQHELRGVVRIDGSARSLVWEGIKGSLAILIRESGF